MLKYLFIVNPVAGGKDSYKKAVAEIETIMSGKDFEIVYTRHKSHAIEIVKQKTPSAHFWLVIVCGGDGTLQEAVCGAAGKSNVAVAHYPCGTGNDFIKHFGKPKDFNLAALIDGEIAAIDLIETNVGYALNCFSVGFDALVAYKMNNFRFLSRFGGKVPYNVAILAAILKGLGQKYTVKLDGKDFSGSYTMIVVMNGSFYGGGFNPIPESDVGDGFLDVLLVDKISLPTFVKNLDAYSHGQHKKLSFCHYHRVKNFEIARDSKIIANMDGESTLTENVTGFCANAKLQFVLPKNLKSRNSEKTDEYVSSGEIF